MWNRDFCLVLAGMIMAFASTVHTNQARAEDFVLRLQSQRTDDGEIHWKTVELAETWKPEVTAIIVCDVWDKHHCLNAVRRLEEFAPRLNEVLKEARLRGATIIHSPSDCMPAYETHPARKRASDAPRDPSMPKDAAFWCAKIPSEELAVYPIDQSDGGEDDEPTEHARWAAELTSLGRNPGMPWQTQSSLIEIDSERDFISDKGDEVWNILKSRGIQNVVLTGVHTNMCVLGRPFGLRQMVRNGMHTVLMRDMTDCMYNPEQWPFVDHFTGNDLIISHVERYVCPTVTSDQILGGQPFRSKSDRRNTITTAPAIENPANVSAYEKQWTTATIGSSWKAVTNGKLEHYEGPIWFRCTVRLPENWLKAGDLSLTHDAPDSKLRFWINGVELGRIPNDLAATWKIPIDAVIADDINLLVIRTDSADKRDMLPTAPTLTSGKQKLPLDGRWQFRLGDDEKWSNIPLPAKFGIGSDVLFEPK